MQNVPYAIVRLDDGPGQVAGYMLVSPYYAALHRVGSSAEQLPVSHAEARLWEELRRLSGDDSPRPLERHEAEETVLLVEEFGGNAKPVLLSIEPLSLASPAFAAERMQKKLAGWVEAEQAGAPLCPYDCLICGDRLDRTGAFAVAHPAEDRKLHYSCRAHDNQEADYSPASGKWVDLRPEPENRGPRKV